MTKATKKQIKAIRKTKIERETRLRKSFVTLLMCRICSSIFDECSNSQRYRIATSEMLKPELQALEKKLFNLAGSKS